MALVGINLYGKDMINTTRWRRPPIVAETIEQPIFYLMQCATDEPTALDKNILTDNILYNGYGDCKWVCVPKITLSAKKQRDYMPIFYEKALEYYANNDLAGYNNYILHYLNNRTDFFTDIINDEYNRYSGFWQTLANNYMARFIYDENHFNPKKQMFGINPDNYYFDFQNIGLNLAVLNGEIYIKLYTNPTTFYEKIEPLKTNKKYNKLIIDAQNIYNNNLVAEYNLEFIMVRNQLRGIYYLSISTNNVMYPQKIEIPLEQLDCNFTIECVTNPTDPANANLVSLTNSDIYIVGEDYYKEV